MNRAIFSRAVEIGDDLELREWAMFMILVAPSDLRLVYLEGYGILRKALAECARPGFSISDLSIKHDGVLETDGHTAAVMTVELEVRGRAPLSELATELNDMHRIVDVHAGDANALGYRCSGRSDRLPTQLPGELLR